MKRSGSLLATGLMVVASAADATMCLAPGMAGPNLPHCTAYTADAPREQKQKATQDAVEAYASASVEDFYENEARAAASPLGRPAAAHDATPIPASQTPSAFPDSVAGKPAEDAASTVANTFPSLIATKKNLDKISPPVPSPTQASPSPPAGADGSIYNGMFDNNRRSADAPVRVKPPRQF